MRSIVLVVLAAICTTLLSACAEMAPVPMANCPALEGYPDCQAGHRIDATDATSVAQR